jgi:hypothetical protein
MPGALDEWQERLERHFSELAASRSGTGFPIFALEHGLSPHSPDEAHIEAPIMAHPTGESNERALRLDFDRRVMLQFSGTRWRGLPAAAIACAQGAARNVA